MCTPNQSVQNATAGSPKACGGTCGGHCREAVHVPQVEPHPEQEEEHDVFAGIKRREAAPSLDDVTTFGRTGNRVVPQPALANGPFYKARSIVGLLLIALYLSLPWIKVGGAPAIFLHVADRRFHLFGATFLSQDLWLAFFLVTGTGFTLFAVTAMWGRIWCGWACPLTVFLDVVRRIERLLEGDGPERRRAEREPATAAKVASRVLKHALTGLLAAIVAHGFLAYFVSIPQLFQMMREAPGAHPGAFLLVVGATGILWFCFAWFREQFCIVLCPYGRLQSVLTDEHTMVIGYDKTRGEPRGKSRGERASGDCVDCSRCVQVCPTGIDIRQGLQLECIGCAACVDACALVMQKLRRPVGLIRYDSLAGLRGATKRFWRPRLALYGGLLVAGFVAASFAFSTVRSAAVSLTRLPGAPYFVQDFQLRNQFLLRVFNKRPEASSFELQVEGERPAGLSLQGEVRQVVQGWGEGQAVIVLTLPMSGWHGETDLRLVVRDAGGTLLAKKPLTLMGPLMR